MSNGGTYIGSNILMTNTPTDNVVVAGGSGTDKMAYSYDGINWLTSPTSIFTVCRGIAWNGVLWVAGGSGTTRLAYSSDGINWTASSSGTALFTTQCYSIAWNGILWVAGGEGTTQLAYSSNGINWTAATSSPTFTNQCATVAWNGSIWLAGGDGTRIAYSYDGRNWLAATTINTIMSACYVLAWNGSLWVAGGVRTTNSIATSPNGINWTAAVTSPFTVECRGVAWNGSLWVAGGQGTTNRMVYSSDGSNWTPSPTGTAIFTTYCFSITWNGSLWITGGSGTSSLAYSYDGSNWKAAPTANVLSSYSYIVASRSVLPNTGTDYAPLINSQIVSSVQGNFSTVTTRLVSSLQGDFSTLNTRSLAIGLLSSVQGNFSSIITTSLVAYNTPPITYIPASAYVVSSAYNVTNAHGCVFDSSGNLYVSSRNTGDALGTITRITPLGATTTYSPGLVSLYALSADNSGNIFFTSAGTIPGVNTPQPNIISKLNSSGTITTVATVNDSGSVSYMFASAYYNGFLYFTDRGTVDRVDAVTGTVTVGTETGFIGYTKLTGICCDNTNFYLLDCVENKIYTVPVNGASKTVLAGSGTAASTNGTGTNASFWFEQEGRDMITIDNNGNLYVTENGNSLSKIRKIEISTKTVTTIAGGTRGNTDGTGTNASFDLAAQACLDTNYNLFIADFSNNKVRKIPTALVPTFVSTAIINSPTENFAVAGGNGTTKMAYSYDGINWIASVSGNSIFNQCYAVAWNGVLWLAGGGDAPGNRLAYSSDGINWIASVSGNSIFLYGCYALGWNGLMWVGCGSLTGLSNGNRIGYSYDGINWYAGILGTGVIGNLTQCVAWNGLMWVVGGYGNSQIAYSYDGINWIRSTSGDSVFITNGYGVAWNGLMWVAGGNGANQLGYSYDGINWTRSLSGNSIITTICRAVAWNGVLWVAGGDGTNRLAYSYNGINWFPSSSGSSLITGSCRSVAWNGTLWIAGGVGTNELIYSLDGINWLSSPTGTSLFTNSCFAIASRRVLPNTGTDYIPSWIKSTYTSGGVTFLGSTIFVSSLTIGKYSPTSTIQLDLSTDFARKLNTTAWYTGSDRRIKADIIDADLTRCSEIVQSIPLRYFKWDSTIMGTSVTDRHSLGFIAQEVAPVFPNAVTYDDSYGFPDFHSLNVDQIMKANVGATQWALSTIAYQRSTIDSLNNTVSSVVGNNVSMTDQMISMSNQISTLFGSMAL